MQSPCCCSRTTPNIVWSRPSRQATAQRRFSSSTRRFSDWLGDGEVAAMNPADIAVVLVGLALSGILGWFFFRPKKAHSATQLGNVQEVTVTVKGGYSPDLVRVRQGVPLRIVFDRQESGECTSRVVFPDFALNRSLSAHGQTTVELLPDRAGDFGFACGMNMIHGKLIVEPSTNGHGSSSTVARANDSPLSEPEGANEQDELAEDHEMAERKAEITDLTLRIAVGALLTAPVLTAAWWAASFRSGFS